ncbi:MAG: type II toxin-antitoxin system VapC family toxin [Longimicrobiales bacterium]
MIVPDLNLLVHAYNAGSPVHEEARAWWETLLNQPAPAIGLAWVVALGYIRLTTHPRIMAEPLTAHEACGDVESWLAQPQVTLLHPGEGHASTLFHLLRKLGTAANLTTDAHLAALAMEYQATLHTTDADFARFSGLRWENPLGGRGKATRTGFDSW